MTDQTSLEGIAGPSSPRRNITQHVLTSGTNSGLVINLHPLPILNVSEHYNRALLTFVGSQKLFGALLGTQSKREISIVNSFELIRETSDESGDVTMGESSENKKMMLNTEFLENRKEQFRQVFPTLDVVGWYSVGVEPTAEDVALHQQFITSLDTPIFLLFDPVSSQGSQNLPLRVFEAALEEGGKEDVSEGKFVELEFAIETGEAERIAVDGISRGGFEGGGEDSSVVGNLATQRNAIRMLYERIGVLLEYVNAVINKAIAPDHNILRNISSLAATLPTMNAREFQDELMTEYSDVQLTNYLTAVTKQLSALSEYAEKHHAIFPLHAEDGGGQAARVATKSFSSGNDFGGSRRRR